MVSKGKVSVGSHLAKVLHSYCMKSERAQEDVGWRVMKVGVGGDSDILLRIDGVCTLTVL
jgi:hypothetical protein